MKLISAGALNAGSKLANRAIGIAISVSVAMSSVVIVPADMPIMNIARASSVTNAIIPADTLKTIVMQIVWSLITGPIILYIINWAQKQIDGRVGSVTVTGTHGEQTSPEVAPAGPGNGPNHRCRDSRNAARLLARIN